MKNIITSIYLSLLATLAAAQTAIAPAPKQTKSVLIMNATAHLGTGEVIENSVVAFKEGKITMVADARLVRFDVAAYDTIIHADGMHLYPGFIAPNTTLGLHETDAVRAQNDVAEVGLYTPSVRSAIAYNTDSEIIPTVRSNGVLIAQVVPGGGVVSGTSSIMQLDAWNWEDALLREDDGLHLRWPRFYERQYEKGKVALDKEKQYDKRKQEISELFKGAKAYAASSNHPLTDLRYAAMVGVFSGVQTLFVHAEDAKSIADAVQFKKDMGIKKLVIVGGYEAWLVADVLRNANVPVLLHRLHDLPEHAEEDPHLLHKMPSLLFSKGVKFCLQNAGDMERMQLRNLPFYAGTAVAYGLPYEEAVKSITLNAAQILGIDSTCGSIELGKDATLFLSKGDALDMRTSQAMAAFIQGRNIDLRSKQTILYEKYKCKYESE
jgi:imidazolonepropionase-like amidohydrolase